MTKAPADADARRAIAPVICYPPETLTQPDPAVMAEIMHSLTHVDQVIVPPRDGRCIAVPQGHVWRVTSVEGPQVGDMNVWAAADLTERLFTGKTRALHGTHVTRGHRLWSTIPHLRSMATIIHDSLGWYGFDEFGGGVHDVIGTRCDPYTHALLSDGGQYHHCCHSNLTRALADHQGIALHDAELLVHDVMNVFMCTGFTRDTGQYFMKASPVRPGDHIDFLAHLDVIVGLSACPGGDCSTSHSSDAARCYPLQIDVFRPDADLSAKIRGGAVNPYDRSHGR